MTLLMVLPCQGQEWCWAGRLGACCSCVHPPGQGRLPGANSAHHDPARGDGHGAGAQVTRGPLPHPERHQAPGAARGRAPRLPGPAPALAQAPPQLPCWPPTRKLVRLIRSNLSSTIINLSVTTLICDILSFLQLYFMLCTY